MGDLSEGGRFWGGGWEGVLLGREGMLRGVWGGGMGVWGIELKFESEIGDETNVRNFMKEM